MKCPGWEHLISKIWCEGHKSQSATEAYNILLPQTYLSFLRIFTHMRLNLVAGSHIIELLNDQQYPFHEIRQPIGFP